MNSDSVSDLRSELLQSFRTLRALEKQKSYGTDKSMLPAIIRRISEETNRITTLNTRIAELSGDEAYKTYSYSPDAYTTSRDRVSVGPRVQESQLIYSTREWKDTLDMLASENSKWLMQKADVDTIAVGDTLVLTQSPGYAGWRRQDIEMRFLPYDVPLPDELAKIKEGKERQLSVDYYNTIVYRLVSFRPALTDFGKLIVTVAPTTFFTFFSISSSLDDRLLRSPLGSNESIRTRYAKVALNFNTAGGSTSPVPNDIAVGLVVVTNDDYLIFMRRSRSVGFYPGTWTISLEETTNTLDRDFIDTALRGIREELGESLLVSAEDVRVLSLAFDYVPFCVEALCIARVHNTASEVRASWLLKAVDKEEADRMIAVPFTINDVLSLVFRKNIQWHTSAPLRALQSLFHKFGVDQVMTEVARRVE